MVSQPLDRAVAGQRLIGKVALVFGVGSVGPGWGNGRASAFLFARHGAQVFGTDIDGEAAHETLRLIAEDGGQARAAIADVTNPADVTAAVQACMEAYGRIDILMNNVGGSMPGGPVDMDPDVWMRQFDTNLHYVYHACRHVIPIMEAQFERDGRGGSIINLASIAALRHFGPDVAAYAASKAAVIKFSQVTAVQYAAKRIRVNTIVPGLMHTPLVAVRLAGQRSSGDVDQLVKQRHAQPPMGTMGSGWDVAHAALFLASDESAYVTATEIVVDGGLQAATRLPPRVT